MTAAQRAKRYRDAKRDARVTKRDGVTRGVTDEQLLRSVIGEGDFESPVIQHFNPMMVGYEPEPRQ